MVTLRVLLTVAILAAFGNALRAPFHYDDFSLLNNSWTLFPSRPLTYLTFWLNWLAGGTNPAGYHAVNLLLHLGAAHLLLTCLRRLVEPPVATAATFLFALHPIQTEPVVYIFARSSVLATLLCLVVLWFWLREKPWWATGAFALALLAKEECAAFPALLWLLPKRKNGPIAAMFGMALVAVARVAWLSFTTPGSGAGPQAGINPLEYLATQGFVILRYLQLLVAPVGFSVDPDIPVLGWAAGAGCWAALGLLAYGSYALGGHRWFVGGLLLLAPTSSIFPAADLAVDRRMYLPLIAFSPFFGMVAQRIRWAMLRHALAAVLALLSMARTEVWLSPETLWAEAHRQAPAKIRPRIQLARALPASRAVSLLEETKKLAAGDPQVASELGKAYLTLGRDSEALAEFGRAVALAPTDGRYYNNRGVALCTLGFRQEAARDFETALRLSPSLQDARTNLERCVATSSGVNSKPPPR
jgi:hypothetical protein